MLLKSNRNEPKISVAIVVSRFSDVSITELILNLIKKERKMK